MADHLFFPPLPEEPEGVASRAQEGAVFYYLLRRPGAVAGRVARVDAGTDPAAPVTTHSASGDPAALWADYLNLTYN